MGTLTGASAIDGIILWNVDDGRELARFNLGEHSVRSLCFSHDGKKLLSGMTIGDTLVWDLSQLSGK
jgi:hypothetical protein